MLISARHQEMRSIPKVSLAIILAIGLSGMPVVQSAYADPPDWAPAHGWRAKKNKQKHHHYYAYAHRDPYAVYVPTLGINKGSCNREVIGTLIGAAGGGYIGSQIGKGDGKLVAVGAGVFLGALLGGSIGRSMDEVDQNCLGHSLESAQTGHTVAWNGASGSHYRMTPTYSFEDNLGRYCREYITTARIGGRTEQIYGTACRQPDGSWQVQRQ